MKFKNLAKSVLGAALGLTLAFGVATPALAATINVTDAAEGESYSAYKLFDVTTSNTAGGATTYAYSIAADSDLITVLEGAGLTFTYSADGSVAFVASGLTSQEDAKALAAYLDDHVAELGSAVETIKADASGTVTFDELDAGYYFVDTTLGSLCILDTTTDTVDIAEKNEVPVVEKEVKAEGSEGEASDENTVSIGDVLDYTITITAQPGAEGYVLHDELSDGLTLDADSIQVSGGNVQEDDYDIVTTGLEDDDCDFEIVFTKEYLDSITEPTAITVTYKATVNENAVIGWGSNTNKAILDYGDNSHTTSTETKTYVYDFDITKVDENSNALSGAEFSLYESEEGGDAIALVDEGNGVYRVATADDVDTTTTIAVNGEGKATVKGLEGKSFWLEETKAPAGYNKLADRVEVVFNNEDGDFATADFANANVVNKAGSELPSTGGMGTTALYVVGGALVAATGITLVVRRRMNNEA